MNLRVSPGVWLSAAVFIVIAMGVFLFSRALVGDEDTEELAIGREGKDVVGLVRIEGGIFDSGPAVSDISKLRKSPHVKSLLLRINSPGGAVGPTQEIYNEIVRFKQTGRKVVASLGSVAASGGYYIASAADKIYSNPGTITGSIGVIMILPNAEKMVDALGLKFTVIKSAPHKDLGSPLREMSKEERGILQRLINDTYGQFVRAVAEGRNMPVEKAREVADGSIFTGERAKQLGLVDTLGSQWDATLEAGRLAKIKGEPEVFEFKKPGGIFSLLRQSTQRVSEWVGGVVPVWGGSPAMLQYMWN